MFLELVNSSDLLYSRSAGADPRLESLNGFHNLLELLPVKHSHVRRLVVEVLRQQA